MNGTGNVSPEMEDKSDEFYPELVAMLINFIDKYEIQLGACQPDYLEQFGSVANNSLFHISKESGVQFLLEEAGWFAGNRDELINRELFQKLKYNLTELYWEQLEQCMPPRQVMVGLNETELDDVSNLKVEDHPDLFEDHVATYSYLPNILLNSLLEDSRSGVSAQDSTKSLNFEGVCMLADISGFTKLTGRCCEEGTSGLDALHDACSGYLGKFVQTVYTYKGDVISFAGDALIVIFPLDPLDYEPDAVDAFKPLSEEDPAVGGSSPEERKASILRARCCQRAVICGKILASFYTDELTAHVGISYGPMSIAKLGGFDNQWVYLMNGACINAISSAVDDASSKQVCVTRTVFENMFTGVAPVGDPEGEGSTKAYTVQTDGIGSAIEIEATLTENDNFRINTFTPRKAAQMADAASVSGSAIVQLISRFEKYCAPEYYVGAPEVNSHRIAAKTQKFNDSVKLFVPKPVIDAISFSTLETTSELRDVTTMFMKLDSYDTEKNRDPLTLQEFCYMAQSVLSQTGGFLRQFLIDDKGCVLIAMWGVPSFSFSNNSSRAVAAGVLIHDGTQKLGHKCSIGITAGTVFVGNIGSLVRRDFVAMGADVNLAARFMGKSKGRIFIDAKTANNLPADFRAAMPLSDGLVLKGVKDLTYAHIFEGDINAHVTIEFLRSIKNTGAGGANVAAAGGNNAMALLPKSISEPIKTRLQKTQRRHQYLTRGKGGKVVSGKGVVPSTSSLLNILPGREHNEHHKPHPVNFIVAEGMAGTGKTTTANFFRFFARKCHVYVAAVTCVAADTSTPLGVVRRLAVQIIGEEEVKNNVVLEKLAEHMHWDVHEGQAPLSDYAKLSVLKRLLGVAKKVSHSEKCARHTYGEGDDDDDDDELSKSFSSNPRAKLKRSTPNARSGVMSYFSTKVAPEIQAKKGKVSASPTSTFLNSLSRKLSNAPVAAEIEDGEADAELPEHTDDEGIFFHMFFVLLNHSLYSLAIDDAHHCDESSWNVIYMMSHLLANSVIFVSLRSLHAHADHQDGKKTFLQKVADKKNSVIHALDSPAVDTGNSSKGSGGFSDLPIAGTLSRKGSGKGGGFAAASATSSKGGIRDVNSPVATKDQYAWNKAHHVPAACIHLLKNQFCIHLVLNPFTLQEVRQYMCKALNAKDLPEDLIQSVYQVSTGSPYWCKQIASFISERGQELFITTTDTAVSEEILVGTGSAQTSSKTSKEGVAVHGNKDGGSSSVTELGDGSGKPKVNPLHVLIICRLESMTVEQQAVIKHASIIGEAFHAALLDRILPQALKAHLIETIAVLVQNCLLFSDDEEGDTYKFGNHLIHQIIYDLTPPR